MRIVLANDIPTQVIDRARPRVPARRQDETHHGGEDSSGKWAFLNELWVSDLFFEPRTAHRWCPSVTVALLCRT